MTHLDRRAFLTALLGGAAALGLPTSAHAFGEASKVDIAELDLGPGTISRTGAWTRLLSEVRAETSVQTRDVFTAGGIQRLAADDPEIFEHPFMVCPGSGPFAPPNDEGLEQLARYLAYGGFILFDDTSGAATSPFYDSVQKLLRVLYPTQPLTPLPRSHSLYRTFFLRPEPVGRIARFEDLEGITLGGVRIEGDRRIDTTITPVIVCRNDLSGALVRDASGRHAFAVVPGGERQRREAVKLGINMIMYALTANYKKDQVHVKELIERQRPSSRFSFP